MLRESEKVYHFLLSTVHPPPPVQATIVSHLDYSNSLHFHPSRTPSLFSAQHKSDHVTCISWGVKASLPIGWSPLSLPLRLQHLLLSSLLIPFSRTGLLVLLQCLRHAPSSGPSHCLACSAPCLMSSAPLISMQLWQAVPHMSPYLPVGYHGNSSKASEPWVQVQPGSTGIRVPVASLTRGGWDLVTKCPTSHLLAGIVRGSSEGPWGIGPQLRTAINSSSTHPLLAFLTSASHSSPPLYCCFLGSSFQSPFSKYILLWHSKKKTKKKYSLPLFSLIPMETLKRILLNFSKSDKKVPCSLSQCCQFWEWITSEASYQQQLWRQNSKPVCRGIRDMSFQRYSWNSLQLLLILKSGNTIPKSESTCLGSPVCHLLVGPGTCITHLESDVHSVGC